MKERGLLWLMVWRFIVQDWVAPLVCDGVLAGHSPKRYSASHGKRELTSTSLFVKPT